IPLDTTWARHTISFAAGAVRIALPSGWQELDSTDRQYLAVAGDGSMSFALGADDHGDGNLDRELTGWEQEMRGECPDGRFAARTPMTVADMHGYRTAVTGRC